MKTLFFLFFTLWIFPISAQMLPVPTVDWEENFGGKRYDEATDIIENMEGNLVVVGQCKNLDTKKDKNQKEIHQLDQKGNSDLLFMIISPTGKLQEIKAIGRAKSERGNAVIQTFDGGYAIAGFTNSETSGTSGRNVAKGMKDAWLIKVDQKGDYLWELRLGGSQHDWLTDIIQDNDGNLLVTGTKGGQLFLAKVSRLGELSWEKTPLKASKGSMTGNALIQLPDSDLAIVGLSRKGRDDQAFFARIGANGIPRGEAVFYPAAYEDATDILLTKKGQLAILSKTFNNKKQDHVGLRLTDFNGKLLTEDQFRFGDRQKDFPFAAIQDFSGDILITGGSKSHASTGTRHKVFLSRINTQGQSQYEEWAQFYGGNFTDKANQILQTSDGSIYLAGHTFSEKLTGHNSDVFIIKIKKEPFPSTAIVNNIKQKNNVFHDENEDDTIEVNERGYFQFQISNDGSADLFDIIAKIEATRNEINIDFLNKITLGYLPAGQTKTYSIPLRGKANLAKGEASFKVSFSEANQSPIPGFNFTIKTKNYPAPILAVTTHKFSSEGDLTREQLIKLQIIVKNTGDQKATNLRGVFSFEKNVENISDKQMDLQELLPNQEHTFWVDFKINKIYHGNNTDIGFRFYASEAPYAAGIAAKYPLKTILKKLEFPKLVVADYSISPPLETIKRSSTVDLKIMVKNEGQMAAKNVKGSFLASDEIASISASETIHPSMAAGEIKAFTYQFTIAPDTPSELAILNFQLDADPATLPEFPNGRISRYEFPLPVVVEVSQVAIADYRFNGGNSVGSREEPIKLVVSLINDGGLAENLVAEFGEIPGVDLSSPAKIEVGTLEKGIDQKIELTFKITEDFKGDRVVLPFLLKSGENILVEKQLALALPTLLPAQLVVQSYQFKPKTAKVGEKVTLEMQISNEGQQMAEAVQLIFDHGENATTLSQRKQTFDKLAPSETQKIAYQFVVNTVTPNQPFVIDATILSKSGKATVAYSLPVQTLQPAALVLMGDNFTNRKEIYKRGEMVTLELELTNRGEQPATEIQAIFTLPKLVTAEIDKVIAIPVLAAGETKQVKFTFTAEEAFKNNRFFVNFKLHQGAQKDVLQKTFPVILETLRPVALAITGHQFSSKNTPPRRDEILTLKVTLENSGDQKSTVLKGIFSHAESVKAISKKEFQKATLDGQSTVNFEYQFKVSPAFDKNIVAIDFTFTANEGSYKTPSRQTFQLGIAELAPPVLVVEEHVFKSAKKPFQRDEEITLEITLANQGGQTTTDIMASITPNPFIQLLSEAKQTISALAAGEKKTLNVTFKIDKDYEKNQIDIPFSFQANNYNNKKPIEKILKLNLEKYRPAAIMVIKQSTTPTTPLPRNQEVNLQVVLANTGGQTAKSIEVEIVPKTGINSTQKSIPLISEINPDQSRIINYTFTVDPDFSSDQVSLDFRYKSSNKNHLEWMSHPLTFVVAKKQPIQLEITQNRFKPAGIRQKRGIPITLEVVIKNSGETTAEGLTGQFDKVDGIAVLSSNTNEAVTLKPGTEHTFSYAFKINQKMVETLVEIPFSYAVTGTEKIGESRTFKITLPPTPPPQIIVNKISVDTKGGITSLVLELQNKGVTKATGIRGKFGFEKNIEAISEKEYQLAELAPGATETLTFQFKPNEVFIGEDTKVTFSFQANEKPYLGLTRERFPIGLAKAKAVISQVIFDMFWESPEENKRNLKGLGEKAIPVILELDIFTNLEMNKENFTVKLDGVAQVNSKSGEDDLIPSKSKSKTAKSKKHTYRSEVLVPEGEHTIAVYYEADSKTYKSESITVNYKPNTLNLHLLAIGISKYDDERNISTLKFPAKDVLDMAEVFKTQEGKLFDKVTTTLICDDCENKKTTKRGIELAIKKFTNDYDGHFSDNDLIIIYISSHGKDIQGKFKILPGDYERDIEDTDGEIYTIDFDQAILQKLRRLTSNHKFLFVDACHSGTAGEDLDEFAMSKSEKDVQSIVLKQLIEKEKNINPMMSCLDYEKSWEHPDWNNGAFTEGMIEAFGNKKVAVAPGKNIKASEDDEILTFGELYHFLQQRVPYIVNEKFKNTQTPYIPDQIVKEVGDLQFYLLDQ